MVKKKNYIIILVKSKLRELLRKQVTFFNEKNKKQDSTFHSRRYYRSD